MKIEDIEEMEREDVLSVAIRFLAIAFMLELSFLIGVFIGSYTYNHHVDNQADYSYVYEPIPEKLLNLYYSEGGQVYFDSSLTYKSKSWSSGYYRPSTNEIHIRLGANAPYSDTLAHELGHFIYYHDITIDQNEWNKIAVDHWEQSILSSAKIEENRRPYYSDPKELFAEECMLYIMRDYDIEHNLAYNLESYGNPIVTSYIADIVEEYYNDDKEVQ